jgi:hypothetical protein
MDTLNDEQYEIINGYYKVCSDGFKYDCEIFFCRKASNYYHAVKGHHKAYNCSKKINAGDCFEISNTIDETGLSVESFDDFRQKIKNIEFKSDWEMSIIVKGKINQAIRRKEKEDRRIDEEKKSFRFRIIKSKQNPNKQIFSAFKRLPSSLKSQSHGYYFCKKDSKIIRVTKKIMRDYEDYDKFPYRTIENQNIISTERQFQIAIRCDLMKDRKIFKLIINYTQDAYLDFGKFKGWRLLKILELDPRYIEWCMLYKKDFILDNTVCSKNNLAYKQFEFSKKAIDENNYKKEINKEIAYSLNKKRTTFIPALIRDFNTQQYDSDYYERLSNGAMTDGQYGSDYDMFGDDNYPK